MVGWRQRSSARSANGYRPDGAPLLQATDSPSRTAAWPRYVVRRLELRAGEVHALVGENGAGKSTLIKILTGAVRPDAGNIIVEGRPVTQHSPRAAKAQGIAAIYQQPALFPDLSVAENLAIGAEPPTGWGRIDWGAWRARAAPTLSRALAAYRPGGGGGDLSMPEQQLVEIARALGADAKVLILDEPTASLPDDAARNLFRVLGEMRARGVRADLTSRTASRSCPRSPTG
jgi:rhamnose transport system ATP-binding protein